LIGLLKYVLPNLSLAKTKPINGFSFQENELADGVTDQGRHRPAGRISVEIPAGKTLL